MRHTEKIAGVIRKVLSAQFRNLKIVDVRVRDSLDADGDRILRVYVIFEGAPKQIDSAKLAGTVRQVRPQLMRLDEDAFPVFSFIANSDLSAGKFEPA